MREPLFIKKNKERWEHDDTTRFANSDELSDRLVNMVDDLAFSQTFYPKGKTTAYLNERAVKFYHLVYRKKKGRLERFVRYFKVDLPLTIKSMHPQIFLAGILFLFFTGLGVLSSYYEVDFLKYIAGQDYIEGTKYNIESGKPFGVYNDSEALPMFFSIAKNNIFIAFFHLFVFGSFFGVMAVYSLLLNGIMFGSFMYFFIDFGLAKQFFAVVMVHGIFELFAFVLAAACGFKVVKSFVFAGTYTRKESLKRGAIEAMQLMAMVFILLLVAAFFESYITRLMADALQAEDNRDYKFNKWIGLTLLITCTVFILWYFLIYPIYVYRLKKLSGDTTTN
jgi:uncharacterized membrane protein SpoIIM required for sporulation